MRSGLTVCALVGACSSSAAPTNRERPKPQASIDGDREHGGLTAHLELHGTRADQAITLGGRPVTDDGVVELGDVLLAQTLAAGDPLRFPLELTATDPDGISSARTVDVARVVVTALLAVERTPLPGGDDDPDRGDGLIWLDETSGDAHLLGTAKRLVDVDWVAIVRCPFVRLIDRRTGEQRAEQTVEGTCPSSSATPPILDWLRGILAGHRLLDPRRPAPKRPDVVGEPATAPATATFALPSGPGTGRAWLVMNADARVFLTIEVDGAPPGTTIGIGGITATAGLDGRAVLDVDATSLIGGLSPLADPAHAALLVPLDVDGVTTKIAVTMPPLEARMLLERLGVVPLRFGDADPDAPAGGLLWLRGDGSRVVLGSAARLIDVDLVVVEGSSVSMTFHGCAIVVRTVDLTVRDRRTGASVATRTFGKRAKPPRCAPGDPTAKVEVGPDEAEMSAWLTAQLAR